MNTSVPLFIPDKLLLNWLSELPPWLRRSLSQRYIFMTCVDSAELTLFGDDAWSHLSILLEKSDFPMRRVARLLSVRTIFTFLLELSDSEISSIFFIPDGVDHSFPLVLVRARKQWRDLCKSELSDTALKDWLFFLQGDLVPPNSLV